MFYYVGNNFIEHKGRNNFETISYILENNYSKKCKEIELEYFNNLNNEKSEQNFILAYFPGEGIISNDEENSELSYSDHGSWQYNSYEKTTILPDGRKMVAHWTLPIWIEKLRRFFNAF